MNTYPTIRKMLGGTFQPCIMVDSRAYPIKSPIIFSEATAKQIAATTHNNLLNFIKGGCDGSFTVGSGKSRREFHSLSEGQRDHLRVLDDSEF